MGNFLSLTSFLFLISWVSTSFAQSSFDAFQEQSSVVEQELDQFRNVLNADDPDRRLQAMTFMLKSGRPHLEKAAKEFGLFSTDESLQNAAVRAIFDSGAQFRLVLTSTGEESGPAFQWLVNQYAGAHDGKIGSTSLIVGNFDPKAKCWLRYTNKRKCFIRLKGNSINFWLSDAQASMTLSDEGILKGKIRTSYGGEGWADATIDLSKP